MRYIQLQGLLQQKMNELERVHLRERELLEGKWKTHSLPARKKANANTSPSDLEGISPTESSANEGGFYRPALSTEDVPNLAMRQQPVIIPPPAQFMLTYHYLDPTYRYVLRPDNYIEAGIGGGGGLQRSSSSDHQLLQHQQQQQQQQQHQQQLYMMQRTESLDTNSASQATASTTQQYHSASAGSTTAKPPAPPPRTCEKHKPPAKPPKLEKQKHCHAGHSCNPCVGHFRWKSSEKSQPSNGNGAAGAGGDNVSLDAYDLASPCCDTQCVPSRRRHRQHKEHVHKHKHRDRERSEVKDKQRAKSQTHASPSAQVAGKGGEGSRQASNPHHHHHHHRHTHVEQTPPPSHHHYHHPPAAPTQSQTGSVRSRYFDLASGLASHCSLHSCTSSEFAPGDSASYTTSISTDTLFWDPKSDAAQAASRQHSTKSRQSYEQQGQGQGQPQHHPHPHVHAHHHHHTPQQQHYHLTATQVQPSQIYPNTMAYVQKPKSWDNLAAQGFGYGYLDTVAMKSPPVKLQIAQQRHSMPRRNPYGRYSTYGDVENYAPPPTEFVGELTTTTTTTITAKSTEELLAACDCLTPQQQQALKAAQYQLSQNQKLSHQNSCQMGYYSHLPRPTADVGISTGQGQGQPGQQQQQQQQGNNGCDVATVSEATRL